MSDRQTGTGRVADAASVAGMSALTAGTFQTGPGELHDDGPPPP